MCAGPRAVAAIVALAVVAESAGAVGCDFGVRLSGPCQFPVLDATADEADYFWQGPPCRCLGGNSWRCGGLCTRTSGCTGRGADRSATPCLPARKPRRSGRLVRRSGRAFTGGKRGSPDRRCARGGCSGESVANTTRDRRSAGRDKAAERGAYAVTLPDQTVPLLQPGSAGRLIAASLEVVNAAPPAGSFRFLRDKQAWGLSAAGRTDCAISCRITSFLYAEFHHSVAAVGRQRIRRESFRSGHVRLPHDEHVQLLQSTQYAKTRTNK